MPNILLLNGDRGSKTQNSVFSILWPTDALIPAGLAFWSPFYKVSALEEPCLHTAVSVLTWLHRQVQVIVSSPHVGLKTQASGTSLPSRTTKWIFHYYLVLIMTFYIISLKTLTFATTWMDLEGIMRNEINQREKDKYCMLLLICGI